MLSLGFPGLTSVAPGPASPYIWFGVVPGVTFKPSRLERSATRTVDKAPHLHVYIDLGLTDPQERQGQGIEVNKRKIKEF